MARRKAKRRKKKGKKKTTSESPAGLPNPRSMEKTMVDLTRLIESQQFETPEEMEAFVNDLMASGAPPPSFEPQTPLERAQEVMYEAWGSSGTKRVRLARKALRISPDCADAYVLLAEEDARSAEQSRTLYEKGVWAGERAIGEELFQTGEGNFWGILETRPYMRARAGLTHLLWYLGEREEAIGHLQDMLRLNPGDNQGHRYTLNSWLLTENRDAEAAENLSRYPDDAAADWAYTRALLTFRAEGDTAKSRKELKSAFERNPHVPAYLLGSRPMPEHLPETIGIGDENEAVDYVLGAMPVWRETPGALPWLVMNRGKRDLDLTGAAQTGKKSRTEQFKIGDSVALKAGQRLEVMNIDVSGWQAWIEDIYEDGDLWLRWDSQSLEAFPDEAIRQMFEELMDWTSLVVEPQFVKGAEPRDKPEDGQAVAIKRMEALGLDPDELLYDLDSDWVDVDDMDWAGPFMPPDYPPFDLDSFVIEAEITRRSEQNAIRGALKAGLGNYYNDLFGYYRYGRRPEHIERVGVPQIFGYGTIEVLNRKSISSPTKLKIVRYTIDIMELGQDQGVPFGLISMLGFAALEGALSDAEFNLGMLGVQYSTMTPFGRPNWLEAVTKDRLIALADWLTSNEHMRDGEKVWWIWQLGRHSEEQPHLGRALLDNWLGRPDVPDALKAEVCWGWLDDKRKVGQPSLLWLLSDAYLMGDKKRFEQLLEEADIDAESLPLPFDDEEDSAEDESEFPFDAFRSLRDFTFMPPSLKRRSIPGLIRYSGKGFEEIAEQFWDLKGSYYIDAINSGIADAIEEFRESIPPERVRFWVERGINYGRAQTRKRFYALSIEFYGAEYLEKAVHDNAKSVRAWARKKLRAMGAR